MDGTVYDRSAYGIDPRLAEFAIWRNRSPWIVWRGERQWSLAPEMVERAWAMYGMGLLIAVERPTSLRDIRDHLRFARSVNVYWESELTDYEELAFATELKELEINPSDVSDDVDLSALQHLQRYFGPTSRSWASVFSLPELTDMNADEVPAQIDAPLKRLALTHGKTRALPALKYPEDLVRLSSTLLRQFDLSSLEQARNLEVLDLAASNFQNLESLLSLKRLKRLEIEGRTSDDLRVLAGLETVEANLWFRPSGAPTELIETAARRNWVLNVSDRLMREARERVGIPEMSDDTDEIVTTQFGIVRVEQDPNYSDVSVLLEEPYLLNPSFSGFDAEAAILARVEGEFGRDVALTLDGDSEGGLTVIRCRDSATALRIASLINQMANDSV